MAEDFTDDLIYLLQLAVQHTDFLAQIRHWDNLKMATDEGFVWVKDFTPAQLKTSTIKSIPFAKFFYTKDNLLFPKGSSLPERKMPSLLWTPMERALPIQLERLNHNLFEVPGQVELKLIPSSDEQYANVVLASMNEVKKYIESAPAVRLQSLQWTMVDNKNVLIKGTPLLPINGKTYWQDGKFLLPVGCSFEYPVLKDVVSTTFNPLNENFIWWMDDTHCFLLHQSLLQPLSIASFRQTVSVQNNNNNPASYLS